MEVNASFYRFPSPNWVNVWRKSPPGFDFIFKVHRAITHYAKLRGKALDFWRRFRRPLKELEDRIALWLFQMPSGFRPTEKNIRVLAEFFQAVGLGNSAVVEFRHPDWWKHKEACQKVGITFCSVDAPELPREIVAVNDVVYLRLHGREEWYSSVYTEGQLAEIVAKIKRLRASRKYILLNNDEGMLSNGRFLLQLAASAHHA